MATRTPKRDTSYYESCPIIFSLNILNKKWLFPIICHLGSNEVMRFNELLGSLDGITNMMLSQALKELQGLGLVTRIQYNEMPLRVEYSLTDIGKSLMPALYLLADWSINLNWDNNWQGCESKLCRHADCPAHNLHVIGLKKDVFEGSVGRWDEKYQNARQILKETARQADPLDNLVFMIEFVLRTNTEEGERQARLRDIYYAIGADKSADFFNEERPVFKILHELINHGRERGVITNDLTNQEIIHAIMTFTHGLMSYWHLSRGSYDIIEKNHRIIKNFVNTFRSTDHDSSDTVATSSM